ncbi:MAG: diguanylate cyclase [Fulvimarina manganoxydans]|uniref:GGDEF domain-containing protein n=1 Tax=Fulvimarina manganoxydans TaxID=937218 RepID=UPI0023532978|nr:diguanylate cyclase [Fulvimarina manganoxydans]MCK5931012.1 diguanylate cyclase [Fulvimarina manganoxydans]
MPDTDFLLGMTNALGIFALVTTSYAYVLRYSSPGLGRDLILGIMFGIGACLAIADTNEFVPGLFIDPRAVMLVLAGPFGGIVSACVAAVMACALRLHDGGVGAQAGAMNNLATAALGVLFAKYVVAGRLVRFSHLLALGLLSNVPLLFILTVPLPNSVELFLRVIGPLSLVDTIGVLILGHVLRDAYRTNSSRERLAREATTDPLTGLSNRRDFERRLETLLEKAGKTDSPVSLLILDIDHFKTVNDTLGHEAGDRVLVRIADVVRERIGNDHLAARYGGEEFVVAMPDTDTGEATAVAECLRTTIERATHPSPGNGLRVTVSIGVSTVTGRFEDAFRTADRALYAAKSGGRNRVVFSKQRLPEAA